MANDLPPDDATVPSAVGSDAPPVPAYEVGGRFSFAPMPETGWDSVISTLLRQPSWLIFQLHQPGSTSRLVVALSIIAIVCLAIYGVVVGSFSGAEQLWAAPLKIAVGALLTAAICLPSLYVFSCLAGANERLRMAPLVGMLLAVVALESLLLVSFAPVAWVFSQSTDSVPFIGSLHLLFWAIALFFGLRLLAPAAMFLGVHNHYLAVWVAIFILVNLQMTTTLRPIIGRADHLLPQEKKFFLEHWAEVLEASIPAPRQHTPSPEHPR